MACSSNDGYLGADKSNQEILLLDQPCQYCMLLHLDEIEHGEDIRYNYNGERYLFFGNVDLSTATSYHNNLITWTPEEEKPLNLGINLGYKREDILPNLPGLAATASQGCAFCGILRGDIISIIPKLGNAPESLGGFNDPGQIRLIITEVSYKLGEYHHAEVCEDQMTTLDSLYVYFTVEVGGEPVGNHSLHYNVYAEPSDPCAAWFNIQKRPFSNRLLSAPAVNRLCELISQSSNEMSASEDSVYLPTRLLDVGSITEPCLRLVSLKNDLQLQPAGADAAAKRYAAISYCWGTKEEAEKQLKTTTNTLKQNLSNINLESMPQTIADAVELCRAIGLQYLWIDALCIIQDDDNDWTRESFEMSNIYANSFITICVVTGTSCSTGFLDRHHNPNTLQIDYNSQVDPSVKGKLFLRMYKHPTLNLTTEYTDMSVSDGLMKNNKLEVDEWALGKAPWFQRGWTFQESHFSKRKLLIGDDMAYMWHGDNIVSMDGTRYDRSQLILEAHESMRDAIDQWYTMVRFYVRRKLSYEKDRLPALSGLARELANSFPDLEYLAGLWKADLHRGLFWISGTTQNYQDYIKPRQYGYVAPSWSWARRPGPIYWFLGVQSSVGVQYTPEFELRAANVVTDKLNPYGRVFSAYLELNAKIYKIMPLENNGADISSRRKLCVKEALEDEKLHLHTYPFHYVLRSENGDYMANLNFDWDIKGFRHDGYGYPNAPLDEMRMLLVSSSNLSDGDVHRDLDKPFADERMMVGLLVMPTHDGNEFERVGLWYSVAKGLGGSKLWEDIQPQIIRLV